MGKSSEIGIYKKKDNKKNYGKCSKAIATDWNLGPKTALSPKIEGNWKCVFSLLWSAMQV